MSEAEQPQKINHFLVPEHVRLSKEEKEEFLNKENFGTRQLPQILRNDPAIAHLGAEVGDVIKIIRQSPTARQTIFYRVVING